jgi:outer membrane protein assembly factor BamB
MSLYAHWSAALLTLRVGVALALILGLAPTASLAWRYEIEGRERVTAVAVDSLGDVFAVGEGPLVEGCRTAAGDPRSCPALRVVKLSGETGEELWRVEVDPPAGAFSFSEAGVTVDDSDNPIVIGPWNIVSPVPDVRKFDGATGTLLWAGFGTGLSRSIALGADDDVNVAGHRTSDLGFVVPRLSAATGEQLWRTTLVGPRMLSDSANDVTVDAALSPAWWCLRWNRPHSLENVKARNRRATATYAIS